MANIYDCLKKIFSFDKGSNVAHLTCSRPMEFKQFIGVANAYGCSPNPEGETPENMIFVRGEHSQVQFSRLSFQAVIALEGSMVHTATKMLANNGYLIAISNAMTEKNWLLYRRNYADFSIYKNDGYIVIIARRKTHLDFDYETRLDEYRKEFEAHDKNYPELVDCKERISIRAGKRLPEFYIDGDLPDVTKHVQKAFVYGQKQQDTALPKPLMPASLAHLSQFIGMGALDGKEIRLGDKTYMIRGMTVKEESGLGAISVPQFTVMDEQGNITRLRKPSELTDWIIANPHGLRDAITESMKPQYDMTIEPEWGNIYDTITINGEELLKTQELVISALIELLLRQNYGFLLGSPSVGKASRNSARVYTPDGYKLMGDIQVGDKVINPDGGYATVLGVFPQGIQKIYRVTMSDGTYTDVTAEHLWNVQSKDTRRKKGNAYYETKTTEEIAFGLENLKNTNRRFYIPRTMPVEFSKKELSLDPYFLGLLLGDGGLSTQAVNISSADDEILDYIRGILPEKHYLMPRKGSKYDWVITRGRDKKTRNVILEKLRELSLMGCRSWEKSIPEDYLYSSIEDRLALLQGLCDTDGSIDSRGMLEFTSTSEKMATQVKFLVESLGGHASINSRTTKYTHNGEKRSGRVSYRVYIVLPEGINPFRLERKASRLKDKFVRKMLRKIVSVEYVGDDYATCIYLDSDNHLYVTDNFIVTHNTAISITVMYVLHLFGLYKRCEPRLVESLCNRYGVKAKDLKGLKSGSINIVYTPAILPLQWVNEFRKALGDNVYAEMVKTPSELRAIADRAKQCPEILHVAVMTYETLKLSDGYESAVMSRYATEKDKKYKAVRGKDGITIWGADPTTGHFILDHRGDRMGVARFDKPNRRFYKGEYSRGEYVGLRAKRDGNGDILKVANRPDMQPSTRTITQNHGYALWQCKRRDTSVLRNGKQVVYGGKVFKGKGVTPTKSYKLALADVVKRIKNVGMIVVDEAHRIKSGDSMAGVAVRKTFSSAQKVMLVTATFSSGTADSFFHLVYPFSKELRELYPYRGEMDFAYDYGNIGQDGKPMAGITPEALRFIIRDTAFVDIPDLGRVMPAIKEEIVTVDMNMEQQKVYDYFTSKIQDYGARLTDLVIWGVLWQAQKTIPDQVHHDELVYHYRRKLPNGEMEIKQTFAHKGIGDAVTPKELAMVDLVMATIQRGERAIVFTTQSDTRSILNRLANILEDAGAKPFVMQSAIEPLKRHEHITKHVKSGYNVLVCNPKLVQEGVSLIDFTDIIFFDSETSPTVMIQASRRTWRLTQKSPAVAIYYLAYNDTPQLANLMRVAKKSAYMRAFQGILAGDLDLEVGDDGYGALGHEFAKALSRKDVQDAFNKVQSVFGYEQSIYNIPYSRKQYREHRPQNVIEIIDGDDEV